MADRSLIEGAEPLPRREEAPEWGYEEGVEWGLIFPDANGEYQSPINLNSREAKYDPSLAPGSAFVTELRDIHGEKSTTRQRFWTTLVSQSSICLHVLAVDLAFDLKHVVSHTVIVKLFEQYLQDTLCSAPS
ncbi:hypothetical protein DUI87_07549 [Hirundo rustica rustica]|uniref:Uncharacterized protein n=1 Tax=Hirundo rustica rustica TaxID=333673 RepID=A0A3M0KQ52_HIRRU|nr:hypothetical protein DUI87_07549 [Hirundo rustica rustica]